MLLDGALGDDQNPRDAGVRPALRHQRQHLALALGYVLERIVDAPGAQQLPDQRLIDDAMGGDPMLFATWEGVEAEWQIVEPILGDETPLYEYEPGTWGPREASSRLAPPGGWQDPITSEEGDSCASKS